LFTQLLTVKNATCIFWIFTKIIFIMRGARRASLFTARGPFPSSLRHWCRTPHGSGSMKCVKPLQVKNLNCAYVHHTFTLYLCYIYLQTLLDGPVQFTTQQRSIGNFLLRARFENNEFWNAVVVGDWGHARRNYLMTPLSDRIAEADEVRYQVRKQ